MWTLARHKVHMEEEAAEMQIACSPKGKKSGEDNTEEEREENLSQVLPRKYYQGSGSRAQVRISPETPSLQLNKKSEV